MPRGHSSNIEDHVKDAIVKVKKDNRDFSANQIRNHLLREHDKYGLKQEEIPQKRSIQKIIADKISNLRDMWASPQEKPWTMGSFRAFPAFPRLFSNAAKNANLLDGEKTYAYEQTRSNMGIKVIPHNIEFE